MPPPCHHIFSVVLEVFARSTNESFKLASNFSRKHSKSGGSCIFIRNNIQTEQVEYLQELGKEKVFEISTIQMPDKNTILTCIYRSPDSDFYEFLPKLELLIGKLSSKGKRFSVVI